MPSIFIFLVAPRRQRCRKDSEEETEIPGSWALLAYAVQQGVIKREVKSGVSWWSMGGWMNL